jgi:hypothetical protein
MTRALRSNTRRDGFVLLEALVALVLLSLTLGLLAGMLSFGRRVTEAGRPRDRAAQFANGSDALAEWIASAVPIREIRQSMPGPVLFDGRTDQLTLVTLSTGDVQPAGLLAVTVAFSAAGAMVFDTIPVPVGARRLPEISATQVLLDHVVSARFSYYGSPAEGMPEKWYDDWTAAIRLPRLIALRAGVQLDRRVRDVDLTYRVFSTEGS